MKFTPKETNPQIRHIPQMRASYRPAQGLAAVGAMFVALLFAILIIMDRHSLSFWSCPVARVIVLAMAGASISAQSGLADDGNRPTLTISTVFPGTTAEVVEQTVTIPVEAAAARVEGLESVRSSSREGVSTVVMTFDRKRNIDAAAIDVMNALAAVGRNLPAGCEPPVLSKNSPDRLPALWLTLTSLTRPPVEMSILAERQIRPRLLAIPNVGGVQLAGESTRLLRITLDEDKLRARGLAPDDVVTALRQQQAKLTADKIKSGSAELDLRLLADLQSVEELERIVIAVQDGQVTYLRDLAVAELVADQRQPPARLDGKPAVALGVEVRQGSDPIAVAARVRKELPHLQSMLPPDIELSVACELVPKSAGKPGRSQVVFAELFCPPGGSPDRRDEFLRAAQKKLVGLRDPDGNGSKIGHVLAIPGAGGSSELGVLYIQPATRSADSGPVAKLAQEVRQALATNPELSFGVIDLSTQRSTATRRYPIELVIQGSDLEKTGLLAQSLRDRLMKDEGFTDVLSHDEATMPSIELVIDRTKAALMGITPKQVEQALQLMGDGLKVGHYGSGDGRIEIRLCLGQTKRIDAERLAKIPLKNENGQSVALEQVAAIQHVMTRPVIHRYNRVRAITVTANPAVSVTLEEARTRCRAAAEKVQKELSPPLEYKILIP